MRIEYEGTIEVQPQYQHVGYGSAAITGSSQPAVTAGLLYALAVFGVLVALRLRLPGPRGRRLGIGLGIAMVCGMAAAVGYGLLPSREMTPRFHRALIDLERLCLHTETWAEAHGRLPSESEWEAAIGAVGPRDGFGQPYWYHTCERPDPSGQSYAIGGEMSVPGRWAPTGAPIRRHERVTSYLLGADGLFATPDDQERLRASLGRTLAPSWWYRHARPVRSHTYLPATEALARTRGG